MRDWFVDTGLFLLAAAYGLVTAAMRLQSPFDPGWLFLLDQIVGTLGCAALWLRRRWPVGLALALIALSAFSELVAGAMLVALFTVAVHRAPRTTAGVFALSLFAGIVYVFLRPEPGASGLLLLMLGVAVQGAAVGWGLFVRHRRQLLVSLKDSAARAEAEAQQRAREAIARDIHDVLGHRLSLLAVHAGSLEFRPDAPPEDVMRAAKVIRESAHQALQDLREVIGVLRAPVGELPQPSVADIHDLAAESDSAGMRVELREDLTGTVPERVSRIAYRVVQEALTNARKYAPGSQVLVSVSGAPGRGVSIEVHNTAPTAQARPATRPGQGLIGLAERASLASGHLEHGPTGEGGWRLTAWLPWPS